MTSDLFRSIARAGAEFVVLAGFGVCAGAVVLRYAAERMSSPVSFDPRNPPRPAERFLVSLGARLGDVLLLALRSALDLLYEASADVGEWFFRHTNPAAQDRFRSRF